MVGGGRGLKREEKLNNFLSLKRRGLIFLRGGGVGGSGELIERVDL